MYGGPPRPPIHVSPLRCTSPRRETECSGRRGASGASRHGGGQKGLQAGSTRLQAGSCRRARVWERRKSCIELGFGGFSAARRPTTTIFVFFLLQRLVVVLLLSVFDPWPRLPGFLCRSSDCLLDPHSRLLMSDHICICSSICICACVCICICILAFAMTVTVCWTHIPDCSLI